MDPKECQIPSLMGVSDGNAPMPKQPFFNVVTRFIRQHTSDQDYEALRNLYRRWVNALSGQAAKRPPASTSATPLVPLKQGDRVRVRSKEEISAMLDGNGMTRGCRFMDGQWPYCGTEQRVFRSMEQFVDERNGRLRKCRGLILLEGVSCEGVNAYGRCDRACLMFWRQEWLEYLD